MRVAAARDPRKDPQAGDVVSMFNRYWTRTVIESAKGVVVFYSMFGPTHLGPFADTISDWIEDVQGKEIINVAQS